MKYDPDCHHRRSIRLKGYDYSQAGVYFVSVCTQNRECLFGAIVGGEMVLNHAGRMVETVWDRLARRFPDIELDESIILPNHIHGIITIVGAPLVGAQSVGAQSVGAQCVDVQSVNAQSVDVQAPEGRHKACPYEAGGCCWGVQIDHDA